MATRKSTTRAKTKTVKAKTPTRTSVSAASSRGSSLGNGLSTIVDLRRILAVSAALYALLAVAAIAMMNSSAQELTTGYLTRDTLASRAGTVFAPAVRVVYDVEIRWAVVAILALSMVLPLLYLTRLSKNYAAALKGRIVFWRWIDLGITIGLITEIAALLSGVQDIFTLKLIGGLVVISALLGWIAERQNENAVKPAWSAYILSAISGILPWLLIAAYAVGTVIYGLVRSPWYVYALYGALVASCLLLAINQINQHRRFRNWKNYVLVERNYLLINMLTKVAFATILIIGLRR